MNPDSIDINNPQPKIDAIHSQLSEFLVRETISQEKIHNGDIRCQSILYMVYWFNRLRNNKEEQKRIEENLMEYIGDAVKDPSVLTNKLVNDTELKKYSKDYVENLLVPTKTVDLVVTKATTAKERDKEVLCIERAYYPFGLALPGGIIKDTDEDNPFNLPSEVFAALRVAGEKVLGLTDKAQYFNDVDSNGKKCYLVKGENSDLPVLRLYPEDTGGYRYNENIKSVLRPSDPRHIVDTIAFKCELEGEVPDYLAWRNKSAIMSPREPAGGFAFGHHREIVAHITSQTSLEKEKTMKEREFIRSLINTPLESYQNLKNRFDSLHNSPEASFPELFPVVDRILGDLFSEETNQMCTEIPVLAGVRDKVVIGLRQVTLKNRIFCPYLPTLLAIAEGVAFFDLVARQKKGFYDNMPKDKIVEHNPQATQYASYHMYRYKYRFNQLLTMIPDEIIIPTYESLSATDLMRVRGVPIRFVGISKDFLYVDEFEQSPEEFFMHDCNHTWRMIMEDRDMLNKSGKSKNQIMKESNEFILEYLDHIKIRATDTQDQRELKKLKKIILFEIVHEDARPFLKEIICKYIQSIEGGSVPFEVPRIDKDSGYMDIVDTLDTGISTLSYVRNKLQHGFYDNIDAQLPQIVDPRYRTSEWISRAAYEMLIELKAAPEPGVDVDSNGNISYDWLMRRTCAVGPDNIHGEDNVDPALLEYGDGAEKLNPKRYQVMN